MIELKTEDLIKYENNEMTGEEEAVFFQKLIDSGMAWTLQGHYGRRAEVMIKSGVCHAKKENTGADGKH